MASYDFPQCITVLLSRIGYFHSTIHVPGYLKGTLYDDFPIECGKSILSAIYA